MLLAISLPFAVLGSLALLGSQLDALRQTKADRGGSLADVALALGVAFGAAAAISAVVFLVLRTNLDRALERTRVLKRMLDEQIDRELQ